MPKQVKIEMNWLIPELDRQSPEYKLFIDIHRWRRPHQSRTERRFIREFIDVLGCDIDGAGNRIKLVGPDDPVVLWSCHTDTVHNMGGEQKIIDKDGMLKLHPDETQSNCLGADDGAGIWIMINMIKRGVPGLYIFHRGEEVGGIGSGYIASKTPELLEGIKYAIAFDRYGYDSIITHQLDGCCSSAFAKSLADEMNAIDTYLPKFQLDETGVFTDTANYIDLIPECTNLSVGYFRHHGKGESVDIQFMMELLEVMCAIKIDNLVVDEQDWVERLEYSYSYKYSSYTTNSYTASKYTPDDYDTVPWGDNWSMQSMIEKYPHVIEDVLYSYGIGPAELADEIQEMLQLKNYG